MSANSVSGDKQLARYFEAVSRENMLSAADEAEVAQQWRQTGDQKLADRLVSANLRFVIKVALEYRNYGFPLLDLIQEGNVGLVRAVKSFDPDKGYRLISYGVWWIRAYIQEFILRSWSLVKIGTTQLQRRLFNHLQSSQKRLKRMVGTSSESERREVLAKQVGGTVRDVEEMERRLYGRDLSIDLPSGDDDGNYSLHERLDSGDVDAEGQLEERQGRMAQVIELRKALSDLGERERLIVTSRHLQDKVVTLRELGVQLGISKERVRQLEGGAMARLRSTISENCNVADLLF